MQAKRAKKNQEKKKYEKMIVNMPIFQYAVIYPNMQKCKNDCGYAIMQKMHFNYAVMQIKNGPICHYAETPQGPW